VAVFATRSGNTSVERADSGQFLPVLVFHLAAARLASARACLPGSVARLSSA
jgi:hypothetical protein